MNKNDILSVREQIQEDLICLLDSQFSVQVDVPVMPRAGMDDSLRLRCGVDVAVPQEVKDLACQIVVDNFNKLNLDSLDK